MIIVIFAMALLFVCMIPTSAIKQNVKQSAQTLRVEGLYPVSFGNKYSTMSFLLRDQYTDCLMINLAVGVDYCSPWKSAITSPCLKDHSNINDMPGCLERLADGITTPDTKYDWYWHGYQVFLRPLLVFMDYAKIRWFNCILMLVLTIFALYLINYRLGKAATLIFMAVLALSHGETIPFTMQYASVFFVTLVSICVLLWKAEYVFKDNRDSLVFFAIGAITVFVDFLTMPTVSLGIPLTFWLLYLSKQGYGNGLLLRKFMMLSIAWGAGYALLMATKWGICALTFDPDVLTNAAQHADKWSGDNPEFGGRLAETMALLKRTFALIWSMNWFWLLLVMIVTIILRKVSFHTIKQESWLLLIALIPIVWSLVLVNHDVEHFGFVWRGYITTLLSLGIFWVKVTDKNI